MTTKRAGGNITGLLALTCEAQEAIDKYDPVHLVGDYEVEKADGTKPVLGLCSVINRGRTSTVTSTSVGQAVVPGQVTVEARGYMVRSMALGGTVAAGAAVGVNTDNEIVATGTGVAELGIALMGGDEGDIIDVLVR